MPAEVANHEQPEGRTGGGPEIPSPAAVHTKRDFGRALTATREAAGLTVRDLARRVGVPLGTVSGWCTGRHLPTLSQRDLFLRLLASCGVGDDDQVEEWLACWLRLRRPLGHQRSDAPTPYRGLEPFQAEHADWFFGRSRLTETLVLRVTSGSPGMVVAVGSSGSGKSSLLRAGLVPALCGNGHRAPGRWQGLLLTPGRRPTSALSAQLALVADAAPDTLEAELRDDPALVARRLRRSVPGQLLLVVDQFEEVFTSTGADLAEQEAFLRALAELSEPHDDALRVVAGMRADFYPDALHWPVLAAALQDNQVTVGPMTEEELCQAIVEPARRAGMDIESGLIDVLLRDLAPAGALGGRRDTGALPLLSHALLATWEQGRRSRMSLEDYRATGGIDGAIAKTAEDVFTGLSEQERTLVRQLFLRLVHVGDNTPDTRRRVALEELAGGLDDDRDVRIRELLGRYVDRRLISADVDGVEISHEALLESWPRLREWIDTDRTGHRLHRRLTEAARGWQEAERDPDALYRGVRLDATTDWVGRQDHRDELNQLEQEFIDASVTADRAERLRERRRTRRLRWLAAALAALLLVSGAATLYSVEQRAAADRERNLAVSRQVAGTATRLADSDPALAAQLAVAAYRIAPTVEATSALLAAAGRPAVSRMVRPGGARQAVAVNPAGTMLAAAGASDSDTAVLLWDLADPARPRMLDARLTGHTDSVYAVAFSADGATLATGSADGTVRLWDVADPARARPIGRPLTGPGDRVLAVEFTSDGTTLAVGSRDTTLRLWDVRDRENPVPRGQPLTGATGAVQSIAFTPGGDLMALADAGGAVRLWDLRDRPRFLGSPLTVSSRVNTVAFSPDGATLAAGSNDSAIRLFSMADPARPVPIGTLTDATGWVNAITFSADGKLLAAANASARVQLWDLTTQRLRLDLPHAAPTTAVAFRDEDRVLYTNGADGVARRWLVPGPVLPTEGREITGLAFHPDRPLLIDAGVDLRLWDVTERDRPVPLGPVVSGAPEYDRMTGAVALHPDGDVLAAATRSGNAILLWDIGRPDRPRRLPARLTGQTGLIEHLGFSHGGDLLASSGDDGRVRLWDISDLARPKPLAALDPGVGFVYASAFTSDDRTLIAVAQGGFAALWDVRDPRRPQPLGTVQVAPDDARSLSISPDDTTLAVGVANSTVEMWDITNPRRPSRAAPPVAGPDGIVHALAFSPDGSVLAGGAGAGQTWLWRLTDRHRLDRVAILSASTTSTWALRFAPGGHLLASASGDVHLWDTDPARAIRRVCANTGDPITGSEWAEHIPDAPYRRICP
ncbi:nSTAND1 domain-containing NTPase [Actinophytocola xanthii]|uniref:HTH cro/C1-type domain-containing protein n=1 Tax=Actinophytocola xanthii TaxID=1912961 RepID=A0A1Q8CAD4_9PSEU|nr:helix-turn-helix domain-containing protein [Actinophytocola xanthii]OLF11327.1 hypothetical protein BU204_30385 [Actinophytocola xanthii]